MFWNIWKRTRLCWVISLFEHIPQLITVLSEIQELAGDLTATMIKTSKFANKLATWSPTQVTIAIGFKNQNVGSKPERNFIEMPRFRKFK